MAKHDAQEQRRRGRDPALPRLLGGRLALDFANTIEGPTGPHPRDFLRNYADLVRWGQHAGILTGDQGARLVAGAERDRAAAAATVAAARNLRDAIDTTFRALARGTPPERPALAMLELSHRAALAHTSLAQG
ncbi:MAG: ABATE domain-containing protein, partial [Thermomicrobiales bacterium]